MKTPATKYSKQKLRILLACCAVLLLFTMPSRAQNASGVWTGAGGDGLWTGDANNWQNDIYASGAGNTADFSQVSISATTLIHLDAPITIGNLIFGNTAATPTASWILDSNATTGNVLTLSGGSSITVNNMGTGIAYINTVITGSGGLIKNGPGTMQLNALNTYTGGTTVNGGTVILGTNYFTASQDYGVGGGGLWILGSPTGSPVTILVNLNGGNLTNSIVLVSNSVGPFVFGNYGSQKATWGGSYINLNGNSIIFSNGANNLGGKFLVENAITNYGNVTCINNSATEQMQMPTFNNIGTVTLAGSTAATTPFLAFAYGANVTGINSYGPALVPAFTAPANVTGLLTINSYNANAMGAITLAASSNVTLNANSSGSMTIVTVPSGFKGYILNSGTGTGPVYITASITTSLTNMIQDSATSPLILSGANTYTNATLVENGVLLANGTLTAAKPGSPIIVSSGGTLGGTGAVGNLVTVQAGGTLAPGTNSPATVGTLTINGGTGFAGALSLSGNLYFKLQKTGTTLTNDFVTGTALLTNLGTGTLTLTNIGATTISNGDTFKLFSQPLIGGNTLTIVSPTGIFTNNLAVNGTITAGDPAPQIISLSPATGSSGGGMSVTITGSSFVNGATVTFGTTPAESVTFNSSTSLTVVTPTSAAGAVTVTVTNPDGQIATSTFTFVSIPAPAVTGISPTNGPTAGGTVVTITGSNFVSGDTVTLGSAPMTAIFNSSTSLSITTSPHAAGTVSVTVTDVHNQFSTLANAFTFTLPTPAIWVAPNGGGDGLWTGDTGNWTNGLVADMVDQTAVFSNEDFIGGQSVHVDASVVIGGATFGTTDTNGNSVSWTVDDNGSYGNILTLATSVGMPVIAVENSYSDGTTVTNSATITAVLAGSNGFALTGGGSLTLGTQPETATNTLTGGIDIENGTLTLYNGAYDANSADTVTLGSTNAGSFATLYLGAAAFANPIILPTNAQGTLTLGGDPVDGEHAAITGPAINLNGNTLNFVAPPGSAGNSYFANGVTGVGTLNLVQNGGGTILNNGEFTFTGVLNLDGDGYGKFSLGTTISNATAINYNSSTAYIPQGDFPTVDVSSSGTLIASSSSYDLPLTGGFGIGPFGLNLTLEANSSGNITISTVDYRFAGNIVNSGTGTGTTLINAPIYSNSGLSNMIQNSATSPLVLTGGNYYTVPTLVSNGLLLLNCTIVPAEKGSPITVFSNGILGGTGVIGNVVTIEPGGSLDPSTNDGVTIGALTITNGNGFQGELILAGNAQFKVNNSSSPSSDEVAGNALFTNAGTGTITIVNIGPPLNPGDTFQLFSQPVSNGNALTISGPVAFINNLAVNGTVEVAGANPPPTISGLMPAFGSTNGGTVVTINGANFLSGPSVTFGALPAASVTYISPTEIMAVTPAQPPGPVTVTVTDSDSQSVNTTYNYVLPPAPATVTASVSSGSLSLVWNGGANENCVLLSTTNIALPLPAWTAVATNAVGANGLSTNTISINARQPQVYYELSIPYN